MPKVAETVKEAAKKVEEVAADTKKAVKTTTKKTTAKKTGSKKKAPARTLLVVESPSKAKVISKYLGW